MEFLLFIEEWCDISFPEMQTYEKRLTQENKAHKVNDASSWWNDYTMTWLYKIVLDFSFDSLKNVDFYRYSRKHDKQIDRLMDWLTIL